MSAIANHLWQSTVVLLAVWALTRALRDNRAAVRHALWMAATVKFILPFDALVALGRQFGSGVPGMSSTPLAQAFEAAGAPFSRPTLAAAAAVVNASGPEAYTLPTATLLGGVWAVGFLIAIAGWIREWVRIASLAKSGGAPTSSPILEALDRAGARHSRLGGVELVVCDSRIEPGIFGIWRPRLLWPRALTSQLSEPEVEAIVAHELCHVSRHDNLTSALHGFVSAVFWFYPVLRLVGNALHLERERACDEGVLRQGYSPRTYAESIVKTCEFCVPSHAMAAGATGNLRARIVGIMHERVGTTMGSTQRLALSLAGATAVVIPVLFGAALAPHLRAQAPAVAGGSPAFEVASVKQNTSGENARGFQAIPGGRVNLTNLTLRELIFSSYQTQDHLVVGGPGWISSDRFDIVAKAAERAAPQQMLPMVRTLLADRFTLVMHRETRDMPIYNLVMARGDKRLGGGLTPSTCVTDAPGAPTSDQKDGEGRFQCGINRFGAGHILLTGSTLDALANRLGSLAPVGRSVVNRSALEGRFDIELSFTPGLQEPAADSVSLFTAIEEQLGLKLESARGPIEVLVIDSVEKPAPD